MEVSLSVKLTLFHAIVSRLAVSAFHKNYLQRRKLRVYIPAHEMLI
jgi:hypothetical protein